MERNNPAGKPGWWLLLASSSTSTPQLHLWNVQRQPGREKVFGRGKILGDPNLMPGLEEAVIQVQEGPFPMATGPWVPCASPTALSDPWA